MGIGLAAIVGCAACGSPAAAPDDAASDEDIADVRLIRNEMVIEALATLRLSSDPVYRVGDRPGEPVFSMIQAGALLSDGRAAIGDVMTSRVTMIGADGASSWSWGGTGQGPREFSRIFSVTVIGADTVVVQDSGLQRLSLFINGDLVRTMRLSGRSAIRALSGDGRGGLFLGGRVEVQPSCGPEPWARVPLVHVDLETGVVDTVSAAEQFEQLVPCDARGRLPPAFPFQGMGFSDAWSGGFVRARSDRPEIVWVDGAGRVTQIARWTAQPVLVTDSMLDDYVSLHGELNAEYIARRPPELEAELVRLLSVL